MRMQKRKMIISSAAGNNAAGVFTAAGGQSTQDETLCTLTALRKSWSSFLFLIKFTTVGLMQFRGATGRGWQLFNSILKTMQK